MIFGVDSHRSRLRWPVSTSSAGRSRRVAPPTVREVTPRRKPFSLLLDRCMVPTLQSHTPKGRAAYPLLSSPLTLRQSVLPSRVVFTAHTVSLGQDGIPGDRARAYYAARAAGGAGMIVMEPVPVLANGGVTPQNYRFADARFVPALRRVVEAVHAHGAVFVSQLYHLGAHADAMAGGSERWAPSPGPVPGEPGALRSIDNRDIDELIEAHVDAAVAAIAAGADGVECMFAYDTLVDAFFYVDTNQRADGYGGSLENRARLAAEILGRLREVVGPERLLGITVTAAATGYEEVVAHLTARCDLDYVAIGNGNYANLHLLIPPMEIEPGFGVQFAARAKAAAPNAAIIAEGRINDPALGERALSDGACDLVGMTRALIADPELLRRAVAGQPERIRKCVGYNLCAARRIRKFPVTCLQNPIAGAEHDTQPLAPVALPRRVVVVGGGLAGLEAARVAAGRGHRVVVLELAEAAGGQVRLLSRLPQQAGFAELIDWRLQELARLGVEVQFGVDAGIEGVTALSPELVIVATGSAPDASHGGFAAADVLAGADLPNGRVAVLDSEGHRKGAGTAEVLARRGRDVTLVPLGRTAAAALVPSMVADLALERLRSAGVRLVEGYRVVAVERGLVRLARRYDGTLLDLPAEVIVHAAPHVSRDALVDQLRARGVEVRAIGDARAPRLLEDAVRDGYHVGLVV
jgi:2,4-dienoyl-CoA reductase-like NADH-dependent reductase (Old Yellow Enzyme family)/thioredoxin reductase